MNGDHLISLTASHLGRKVEAQCQDGIDLRGDDAVVLVEEMLLNPNQDTKVFLGVCDVSAEGPRARRSQSFTVESCFLNQEK